MRIRFLVTQTMLQTPKTAEIRVYNLSDETVARITGGGVQSHGNGAEGKPIVLNAGYQGNSGAIFSGTVKKAQSGRENPTDTFVDFYCAEEQGHNWAIVNKTFAAGSKQQDHVDEVLRVMKPFGIIKGTIDGLSKTPYPRAVSLYGMARDVMRNIAHSNDASWFIDNGKLHHIPTKSDGDSGSAFTLNANTGLIGRPVETEGGIIVTALINPQYAQNKQLIISQKSINRAPWQQNTDSLNNQTVLGTDDGTYVILAIEWRGDTRGNEYYATMTCRGVSGSDPNSAVHYGING